MSSIFELDPYSKSWRKRQEEKLARGTLTFVVGMQFGSEAKGSVVQYLSPGQDVFVRTGAPNAGHTVFYNGAEFVNRQIPCGWVNSYADLVIGRSAQINLEVFNNEVATLEKYIPIKDRLKIDPNAQIITEAEIIEESKSDLAERIGSTSARSREGIGQAMADKVLRKETCLFAKDCPDLKDYLYDTTAHVNKKLNDGLNVLIEGTQGFGLSLDYGFPPFVTSRNVTVPALADSVGVNTENFITNSIGVVRSFPIRVAGSSGPFGKDSHELTWDEMCEVTGNPNLIPERTSVTQLERRIGTFSEDMYKRACMVNSPTEICLTFADYLDPSVFMKDSIAGAEKVWNFIDRLEKLYPAAHVSMVNTGPSSTIDLIEYRRRVLEKIRDAA